MLTRKFCRTILAAALFLSAFAAAARADETQTARSEAVVRAFYTTVFIGRNIDAAPRFIAPGYVQHNPQVPTGLKGLMDTFRPIFAQKYPADYKREILAVVAQNDMVIVYHRQSWTKDAKHQVVLAFDMFRVKDGLITEHWDADS